MSEIVYYLDEKEAKKHGKIEAVVSVFRIHKVRVKPELPDITDDKVESEPKEERIWDDQHEIPELDDDEELEEEKVYYKVIMP
jgi:hypothetical protein